MKTIAPQLYCCALSLGLLAPTHAGESDFYLEEPAATPGEPDAFQWLTPSVDLLTRYEFREVDGQDPSNALTARARVGLTLGDFGGFSAFAEGEFTGAAVSDYRSNPTGNASTYPYVTGNTPIGDPQNAELNRAWVQYKKNGILAKVGRQRIIRNNAAFIGNVGWRQNEQTFDAAQIAYTTDDFSLSYAYSNRVQRIFGNDANDALPGPPLQDFEGDFHFIDGSYTADFGTIGGYAYLIDVDNNANVGESNTYGAYTKAGPLYAEVAFQEGTSAIAGDYDAMYGHIVYTQKVGDTTFSAGFEYLGNEFKTPFATVHAFNGFADQFILTRIGLNSNGDGLSDAYLGLTQPLPGGVTFKGFLHYFADDSLSETYGYEADAVLVKKFSDNVTGLVKAAYYFGENGSAFQNDIKQVSVQVGYKF